MKYVKMLGLAAVAAAALMAFVGAGTASATTLTSPAGTVLKTGSTIEASFEATEALPKATLTTTFKNIECESSSVKGKTTNESGATISGNVESLTWGGCNCEVTTLNGGTLSITSQGNGNGTLSSNGAEVTTQCNGTIFGNVHCIYKTSNTELGTVTGSANTGATATLDVEGKNIPRLTTNALCAEKAAWDAHYKVTNPDSLFVD